MAVAAFRRGAPFPLAARSGRGRKRKAVPSAEKRPVPEGVGQKGRRTLIKGGVILSMDEGIGDFAVGDVLIEGSKIAEVAASIDAPTRL